jgi:hypothetical protein
VTDGGDPQDVECASTVDNVVTTVVVTDTEVGDTVGVDLRDGLGVQERLSPGKQPLPTNLETRLVPLSSSTDTGVSMDGAEVASTDALTAVPGSAAVSPHALYESRAEPTALGTSDEEKVSPVEVAAEFATINNSTGIRHRAHHEQLEISPIHESSVATIDTPSENTYGLNEDAFGTLPTTPSFEPAKSSIDAQRSSAVSSQEVTTSSNLRETWSGMGINQFWASLNSSAVVPARACLEGVPMVTPGSSVNLSEGSLRRQRAADRRQQAADRVDAGVAPSAGIDALATLHGGI